MAKKKPKELTRAERVLAFIDTYCVVPEGEHVGKPMVLAPFQRKFINDIYDNPHGTRRAILSLARKNGKTGLIACLMLAHIIGPEAVQNSQIISGAMSRDQAALVFSLASKMLDLNPALAGLYKTIPSGKKIYGLARNVEYRALAADGTTAHGLSPVLAILDETGQVVGSNNPFIEAITTSQGAHKDPLLIVISTQAASDADLLSLWIDDALKSEDKHTVCHLYAADPDCDLLDRAQWVKANPALGVFRSEKDLEEQLKQAQRIPSMENSARNLLLNQKISRDSLWISPSVWKENNTPVNTELFNTRVVHIGLDLSMRQDLTAAVISVLDDNGIVHFQPHVFLPEDGIDEKGLRDKAPYRAWVRSGHLVAVPGRTVDYEWVATYLREATRDMAIGSIQFDRWGIENFKQACASVGFDSMHEWVPVGQGYRDFSPRLKAFETALLKGNIAHGNHPLLNMAVQNAISIKDPAGNMKLDKAKSSLRIDPLVASVMAAMPCLDGAVAPFDISAMIV